jgi:hypothetical protein
MEEANNPPGNTPEVTKASPAPKVGENEKMRKLVAEMLAGKIVDIRPQLDFTSELGFFYPAVEQTLEVKSREAVVILESLVTQDILCKNFFDKLLRCPQCQSLNLIPSTNCPKCGSGNITRGRLLEHIACKYVGLESEFVYQGRYVCPNCKQELRTLGSDYRSLGVLRKCHDCDNVFNTPALKWRCLKCSSVIAEGNVDEVNIYSYRLNEARRSWLEFELNSKPQLIDFLRRQDYQIEENATIKGSSGAQHNIDILATRDDGIINYSIAIGVEVSREEIGLSEVFDFDDKAYDSGIHDKVLVVSGRMTREARQFAHRQKIKVLEVKKLATTLASAPPLSPRQAAALPFKFKSLSHLIQHLEQHGYQVTKNAKIEGISGAEHRLDIMAIRDEGIITHYIAVGTAVAEEAVGLDELFAFDAKSYDAAILNKVFIAVPGVTPQAWQFARRQKITVLEAKELEPLLRGKF